MAQTTAGELALMQEDGVHVDATNQLVPTAFFVAYQGLNDLPVMQARGTIIQSATPLPSSPSEETPQRPAIAPDMGGVGKIRSPPASGFMSAYFRDHTIGRLTSGASSSSPKSSSR